MFKFNNTHIFTGYLKQLLSSFNLPTCKVYTKEFANYFERHGKEDPRVIESFDPIEYSYDTGTGTASSKKRIATRINYLRGNEVYNYFWAYNQNMPGLNHKNMFWKRATDAFYNGSTRIPGLTKTLANPGNLYDTDTHEYLGEYLRFLRDYYDVNLMSMYNCFNNKLCSSLYYKHRVISSSMTAATASDSKAIKVNTEAYRIFDAKDSNYRIYAIPVKLFSNYTVAIDCNYGIEMFCGFYKTTLDTSDKSVDLINKTYKKFNRTYFNQPLLYDRLDVKYWNFDQDSAITDKVPYPQFLNTKVINRWDIANREQDLKLFIKIPASCKSSIVILEGDFRTFNNFKYFPTNYNPDGSIFNSDTDNVATTKTVWEYKQNHTVVNFENEAVLNEMRFTPTGKLQLLAFNTGESYPFADRLVEYLSGSAITAIDEITDNIKRAQKVMSQNRHYFKIDGLWEDKMRPIIYDYLTNSGPVEVIKTDDNQVKLVDRRRGHHPRLGHTSKSTLYDVLGYIDKDAEKWYASWTEANGKAKIQDSIQNVDIYNGLYDI